MSKIKCVRCEEKGLVQPDHFIGTGVEECILSPENEVRKHLGIYAWLGVRCPRCNREAIVLTDNWSDAIIKEENNEQDNNREDK